MFRTSLTLPAATSSRATKTATSGGASAAAAGKAMASSRAWARRRTERVMAVLCSRSAGCQFRAWFASEGHRLGQGLAPVEDVPAGAQAAGGEGVGGDQRLHRGLVWCAHH